jgi:hypothetical protein
MRPAAVAELRIRAAACLGAVGDKLGKIRVVGSNGNVEKGLRSHAAGRGPVRSSDRKWWGKQSTGNQSPLLFPCFQGKEQGILARKQGLALS